MGKFDLLTEKHVLQAAKALDNTDPTKISPSTRWDIVVNDKKYPPKEIVRLAYKFAYGKEIDRFSGGPETNDPLINLGFEVIDKHLQKVITKRSQVFVSNSSSYQIINKTMFPINQILYGPPGTGKTYITKAYAVAIAEKEDVEFWIKEDNREFLKERYAKLQQQGRIQFCTFHQSMSYEDFVEGIKPVTKSDRITYEILVGQLLKIVDKIKSNKTINIIERIGQGKKTEEIDLKNIAYNINPNSFLSDIVNGNVPQDVFDLAIKLFYESFYSSDFKWPSINGISKSFEISKNENTKNLLIESSNDFSQINERKLCIDNDYGSKQPITISKIKDGFNMVKTNDYLPSHYSAAMYLGAFIWAWFKETYKDRDIKTIHSDKENIENYVLIIDEINRGNIAAIFGELITLLEDSKRIGADDETWVTLTYSKEQFCLPPNLYIIGTMNTADRSVEALDTALRRRFSFIEMPPRPEILSNDIQGVDVRQFLKVINQRITALKDSDHTIGHAWFMGCKSKRDVLAVMVDKVVPLLREHFYNETEKLEAIIGSQFFESSTAEVKFLTAINGIEKGSITKRLLSREELLAKEIDLKQLY